MNQRTSFFIGIMLILVVASGSIWLLSGKEEADASHQNEAFRGLPTESKLSFEPQDRTALSSIPLVLPIPETLTFCGERVPLERPDILERFEKELYITAHRYYQVVFYLKRGPRVYPELLEIIDREKAPRDLIYLSTVESDLLPTIKSPVGAKGLWQFMPRTAPRYGMKVNRYIDERMHLEKATRGAIEYMREAKEKFGTWTTAAAAYNMGMNRTKRTIEKQKTDSYYEMYLNDETSRYVFRILAVKAILENPEVYGYKFPEGESYERESYETIQVKAGIDNISEWAKQKGFTYYDMRRLNPWMIGDRLPKGNYELRIPA